MGKFHGLICHKHLRSRERSEKYNTMKKIIEIDDLIISDLEQFDDTNKISDIYKNHYKDDGKIKKYKKSSCQIEHIGFPSNKSVYKYIKLHNILNVNKCNSWSKKGSCFCKKHHELVEEKMCKMKMDCGCICGLITGNLKEGNEDYCIGCYYKIYKKNIPFYFKPASFEIDEEFKKKIKDSCKKLVLSNTNTNTNANANVNANSNANANVNANSNTNTNAINILSMLNYDIIENIIQYVSLKDLKTLYELNIPYVGEYIEKYILKKKLCDNLLLSSHINFIYKDKRLYIKHMLQRLVKLYHNQFIRCENYKNIDKLKYNHTKIKTVGEFRNFIKYELVYC
jgi:hypothetical protein